MTRLGMVINLKKCVGCHTCTVACKVDNFVPPGIFWNDVYDYEVGEYPNVTRSFLPVPCQHCKSPACKDVCPTGATVQREDGIVYVDYDKCLGCGYCEVACPYRARRIYREKTYYFGQPTPYEQFPAELRAPYQRHKVGTASKCTFCMAKVDKATDRSEIGVKPDATPTCVNSCIAKARYFGDLDDPQSEVSRLIRERKGFRLLEELGTDPSVYYLPR
ncbi:MAG: 4Fe-4S dicluster domain-containing protein [Dehalococcoidia bacterium]|nr:4Fe-4S dicluster domain-containing protein [Dehalococcoidia bacterium]